MPPPGGYDPFHWWHRTAKRPIRGWIILGALYGVSALAVPLYFNHSERLKKIHYENNELRLAISPFLIAESQRAYLKHINKAREAEKVIMSDVPGWEVGKWFSTPVFNNPRNLYITASANDYLAHLPIKTQHEHQYYMHWF